MAEARKPNVLAQSGFGLAQANGETLGGLGHSKVGCGVVVVVVVVVVYDVLGWGFMHFGRASCLDGAFWKFPCNLSSDFST